jgi:hypothetical protein
MAAQRGATAGRQAQGVAQTQRGTGSADERNLKRAPSWQAGQVPPSSRARLRTAGEAAVNTAIERARHCGAEHSTIKPNASGTKSACASPSKARASSTACRMTFPARRPACRAPKWRHTLPTAASDAASSPTASSRACRQHRAKQTPAHRAIPTGRQSDPDWPSALEPPWPAGCDQRKPRNERGQGG